MPEGWASGADSGLGTCLHQGTPYSVSQPLEFSCNLTDVMLWKTGGIAGP